MKLDQGNARFQRGFIGVLVPVAKVLTRPLFNLLEQRRQGSQSRLVNVECSGENFADGAMLAAGYPVFQSHGFRFLKRQMLNGR
jgi:hypothetical protein